MPRSLTLGNGNILVCLDTYAEVRDFYFPFVGLENHVRGHHTHKVGIWVDNAFGWLDDGTWKIEIKTDRETLAGITRATHKTLEIQIDFHDIVYNEKNIFIREVTVTNLGPTRSIKLFFHQAFEIAESHRGDTAFFDPKRNVIIHYKGRRVFLINARDDFHKPFSDYSIGVFEIEGKEGTYKDAEEGILSKNPVEHGKVDSVIGFTFDIKEKNSAHCYYWITASETIQEAYDLNNYIIERTEEHLVKTTVDFWRAWVNKERIDFGDLGENVKNLFYTSLLVIRAHADNRGGIIASSDSDMLQNGRDTYSYIWPRDASVAALALTEVGDFNVARRFFEFCNNVVSGDGYFFHKYQSDASLGSSWHPWIRNGKAELPIQEDETAWVLYALWYYYEHSKDLEFIEQIYNSLIRRCAEFLSMHIDEKNGLPLPSYDLWEEKYGISTFTAATVCGALQVAEKFANILGKTGLEKKYYEISSRMKKAILEYLWDDEQKMFSKMITIDARENIVRDKTIDISNIHGLLRFGIFDPNDKQLVQAMHTAIERLSVPTSIGGISRYENDQYYRVSQNSINNPWIITTLWYAQYLISTTRQKEELEKAKERILWVVHHASSSGMLSEQLNPYTGAQISASPLVWSHAEFVLTVMQYLKKKEKNNEV